jgi:hypothetical protein
MTIEIQLEITSELRPFQKAVICSIEISGHLVMSEKTYSSGTRSMSRPAYRTLGPRISKSRHTNRLYNSYSGRIISNSKNLDCSPTFRTDLSVALKDKSVITTDFVSCFNKLEFFETTKQIGWDNRFFSQVNLFEEPFLVGWSTIQIFRRHNRFDFSVYIEIVMSSTCVYAFRLFFGRYCT